MGRRGPGSDATPPDRDEPIVYLATVANQPLADLCVGALAQAGIRALAKARGPGFGAWASVVTLEHDLHVLRSDHDRAARILAELNTADPPPADPHPNC